jgi:hypothetical protein
MSWDKHHDYRMQDLRMLGPIAARVIQEDSNELKSLREENEKLREECEYIKSLLFSSRFQAFANGFISCGLFFGFVLVSVVVYLLIAG